MSIITMKQLLETGVHFGHQTRRWNPKISPYIYTKRNGIYIINLQKSVSMIIQAYKSIVNIISHDGVILFVGTKKQAKETIKNEAERCNMPYINNKWLGGTLTNFETIQSRIIRYKEISKIINDDIADILPKKEAIKLKKEYIKLKKKLYGIRNMQKLPDIIFVVDIKKENTCIKEAHKLNIPLIGICDTNCDPDDLTYAIPGNDDAIRAIKLIVSKMADAVIESKQIKK